MVPQVPPAMLETAGVSCRNIFHLRPKVKACFLRLGHGLLESNSWDNFHHKLLGGTRILILGQIMHQPDQVRFKVIDDAVILCSDLHSLLYREKDLETEINSD